MKAFLQYLLYLLTGKTVQQQLARKVKPPVIRSAFECQLDANSSVLDYKLGDAKAYLGEKWLLHPANRVQRKRATLWADVRPSGV